MGMKTILLVDDDQQVRESLGLALRRNGYYVIEADSGDAALQMARLNLPDLIVSDIDMPGGDGASLLHTIKLDPALKSRQIVMMSGKPDLLAHRRSMEEGADDFLVKPFGLQEFLSCVKARFYRALLSWPAVDQIPPSCAYKKNGIDTQSGG
jgi:two-component system alkaline phosphatase synthesis response regulator PhoP